MKGALGFLGQARDLLPGAGHRRGNAISDSGGLPRAWDHLPRASLRRDTPAPILGTRGLYGNRYASPVALTDCQTRASTSSGPRCSTGPQGPPACRTSGPLGPSVAAWEGSPVTANQSHRPERS